MSHGTVIRAPLISLLLAGCGVSGATETSDQPDCGEPAPRWLVATIQDGMATDATLTDAYVINATDLSGLPLFDLPTWAQAWWIIGLLEGAPENEQNAIWLTNSLDETDPGLLLSANYGSQQNSEWGADVEAAVGGRGTEDHEACLGLE